MRSGWVVRAPASSANLGSAFDALAVALASPLEVTDDDEDAAPETHPAVRAFRIAGGTGPLTVRTSIPGGRGLGFSGAARVAGLLAAHVQRGSMHDLQGEILRIGADLEGHADNVAASLLGGVVVVAGGHPVRVPLACDLDVVVWVPDRETATTAARRRLPDQVAFDDAVFNVGRASLLVAALAAGDVSALRIATQDRLHQDRRLAGAPETRAAIEAALDAGAHGAWLSGSGPTAAAFVDPARSADVAAALPVGGRAMVLRVADEGAVVL